MKIRTAEDLDESDDEDDILNMAGRRNNGELIHCGDGCRNESTGLGSFFSNFLVEQNPVVGREPIFIVIQIHCQPI